MPTYPGCFACLLFASSEKSPKMFPSSAFSKGALVFHGNPLGYTWLLTGNGPWSFAHGALENVEQGAVTRMAKNSPMVIQRSHRFWTCCSVKSCLRFLWISSFTTSMQMPCCFERRLRHPPTEFLLFRPLKTYKSLILFQAAPAPLVSCPVGGLACSSPCTPAMHASPRSRYRTHA